MFSKGKQGPVNQMADRQTAVQVLTHKPSYPDLVSCLVYFAVLGVGAMQNGKAQADAPGINGDPPEPLNYREPD